MHALLLRQMRKLGIDPETPPLDAGEWAALLERVSRNYTAADQERYLLERSLNLASAEMRVLYEHQQAVAEQRYQDLFESANDVIFTAAADGRLTSVNRACEELTGYPKGELLGRPWQQFFTAVTPSSGPLPADARFEVNATSRTGQGVSLEFSTRVVTHAGEPDELLGVGRDISERRMNETRLEYLAHHDPLTGLPNRGVLEDKLVAVLSSPGLSDETVVLGLLDLDDFKLVNDTMGHSIGDEVLVMVADVLRRCLPRDTVARISGDEFAFIVRARSDAEALQTAERVRREIGMAELHAQHERLFVSASIGLVRADAAASPGRLLAEADAAMYRAKEDGRNRVHWSASQDSITGRLAVIQRWGAAVRSALDSGRLEVHYQPIVPLRGGGAAHYEALIRMRGDDGEPVPAALFLPGAERSGLMPAVDHFVLRTVLQQLREAPQARIFANLSAATLANPQVLASLKKRFDANRE